MTAGRNQRLLLFISVQHDPRYNVVQGAALNYRVIMKVQCISYKSLGIIVKLKYMQHDSDAMMLSSI